MVTKVRSRDRLKIYIFTFVRITANKLGRFAGFREILNTQTLKTLTTSCLKFFSYGFIFHARRGSDAWCF